MTDVPADPIAEAMANQAQKREHVSTSYLGCLRVDQAADVARLLIDQAVAEATAGRVTPDEVAEQRAKGWPDFHPEDFCHRCGRRNPKWFSPDWHELPDGHAGILCPACFAITVDPDAIWVVSRISDHDESPLDRLAPFVAWVSGLDPAESRRVASCLLDAGYQHWSAPTEVAITDRLIRHWGDPAYPDYWDATGCQESCCVGPVSS